jgi:acetyl-CoA carboxylase carboxyltransferase component
VHHVSKSESDAFEWVKTLLGYLPSNCHEQAPLVNPGLEPSITESDLGLDTFLPDSDNTAYDMHDIIMRVFDDGDFHEIGELYAPNVITAFTRVDGRTVGVVANQPTYLSGALDIASSEKAARFIYICDAFAIPVVFLVDIPGYLPGLEQERAGVIYRGAKLLAAVIESTVPKVTVVIRKAYGGGYAVMGSKNLGADLNFAWPTARIAVMGAEGAVGLLRRREIEAAGADGPRVRQQFIDFYNEHVATPYTAAERGYIDAVIEPSQTRLEIRRALKLLADKTPEPLPPRRRSLLRPV